MSGFSFLANPNGRAMTDADFMTSALDQPMSAGSTFFDQAKGGVLESFGLGTILRTNDLPALAVERRARGMSEQAVADQQERLSQALSADQYKASPSFRQDVPFEEGMTEDRAAALADQYDARKVREFYADKRPVTSFFGKLAGSAIDPINYIPIAGEAVAAANVARFGRVAGRALTSSIDAAANTALAGALTSDARSALGDDVSWQSTMTQIGMAALVGSAFGAIHGRFGRQSNPELRLEAERSLAKLERVQEARVVLNDAIDGMVNGRGVEISPASESFIAKAETEALRLGEAWDQVRQNPNGAVRDPLIAITPDDIEGTLIARGAFKDVNEAEFSRSGWGLVKIIWRHGPESQREAPEFQIRKEDITDFPNVIRNFEPEASPTGRTWRVERDGRTVVYGERIMDGDRHIVTAFVHQPRLGEVQPQLSQKKPATGGSSPEGFRPGPDTAPDASSSQQAGQPSPAPSNIRSASGIDKSTGPTPTPDPQLREASQRVAKPEMDKELARQLRIDPATGDFAERGELDQLIAEGRVTDDEKLSLDAADEDLKTATAWGEALKVAMSCTI